MIFDGIFFKKVFNSFTDKTVPVGLFGVAKKIAFVFSFTESAIPSKS